ncbi:hypothetical protein KC19_12G125300 [Ceratodon purpureus]|uniref:Secreted protein n=1 Tax=Ceratodon purpureus TaxID=3225 RepID=A0A8T0G7P6_CERPU|nr:hypothetical protein KC19_12G125300 [Ceratodon purpureus]
MAREESLRMGALVIAVFASALQTCRSKKNIAKLEESAMFKLEVLAFRKSGISLGCISSSEVALRNC